MSGLPSDPATWEPSAQAAGHTSPRAPRGAPASPPEGTRAPAGAAPDADDAAPAGTSGAERAAQREQWGRMVASCKRGRRGDRWRRQAARGTLPDRAGMVRKTLPPETRRDAGE